MMLYLRKHCVVGDGKAMAKIGLEDIKRAVDMGKKAVDVGKELLPIVKPLIDEHGAEVADAVADGAKRAGALIGNARAAFAGKLNQRKDAKESKKSLEEARRRAVAASLPAVDAKTFCKSFEDNVSETGELTTGYMAIPGCYAIITLKSQREKDLAAYRDVYVGCSETIGFDVYSQLRGFGNVDVYADFKFKQPMLILVYPCDVSQMADRFASLVRDLQSATSYNKWEALNALDGAAAVEQ